MVSQSDAQPKTSNISARRGEPLVVVEHVDKHFG
ncbi:MAG TPA: glutamate ABC transporter ATP-binding protein, partial [Microbacterium sp.]|nr:glutamate ABC transporter ATP-binding protein [Microbacterium sp.]